MGALHIFSILQLTLMPLSYCQWALFCIHVDIKTPPDEYTSVAHSLACETQS